MCLAKNTACPTNEVRPPRLVGLLVGLLALGLAGCEGTKPRAAPHATAVTSSSPPRPVLEDAGPPVPRERIEAALSGHGRMQGTPVSLGAAPGGGQGGERFVAFVGSERVTRGSCFVTLSEGPPKVEVVALPPGVRVLFAAARAGHVEAVVESVAVLDQPAGLRGIWLGAPEGIDMPEAYPLHAIRSLASSRDAAELSRRIAEGPAPGSAPEEGEPAEERLARVGAVGDLVAFLPRDGVEVLEAYQSTFPRLLERIDVASLPRSPRASSLVAITSHVSDCAQGVCRSADELGRIVIVRYSRTGGSITLRSFELPPTLSPPALSSAPRLVPALGSVDAPAGGDGGTEAALRELGQASRVKASALLREGGGRVSLLEPIAREGDRQRLALLVEDGDLVQLSELELGPLDPTTLTSAFVDADGDGRTDLVVQGKAAGGGAELARLFLTPNDVGEPGRWLSPDPAAMLALRAMTSVQAAARAALLVPRGAIPHAEACQAILSLTDAKAARARLVPGARFFTYDEPSWFEVSARPARLEDVIGELPGACHQITCEPTRPLCTFSYGPETDWFWLSRLGPAVKLSAVARYNGS